MRTTLNTAKTVTYSIVGWLVCVGCGALGLLAVWTSTLTVQRHPQYQTYSATL